jgi:mannose-6-phosphate isomerase-like protein (cupin superfamily)
MERFRRVSEAAIFSAEKMKKVNLFDTDRMFCDVYGFEPGQAQTAHAHADSDKVYYVVAGTGRFHVGGEERDAGPGTAVLAPAGEAHGVTNPGPERLEVLVLMAPKP